MSDLRAPPAQRWFRVGCSVARSPDDAGRQAATAAIADRSPSLCVVFASALYDVGAVLDGVCSVVPDETVLIGATSMGELASTTGFTAEETRFGPSVVIAALGGPGFVVRPRLVRDASADKRAAGARAASVIAEVDAEHKVLLMIVDGLTRGQHELVRGAYSVLGASVPIVGGCSADNLEYAKTEQFFGTGAGVERLQDSIVAVGLGSNGRFGVGVDHGWQKIGPPMVVTNSKGGMIFMIDNEPALDVYLNVINADRALVDDEAKFREVAFEHPLGLSRGNGEDIRVVHSASAEEGTLQCLADVPQGALIWTMASDVSSLVGAASRSCEMALEGLQGEEPLGTLVFDCGARKIKLKPEFLLEEQRAIAATVRAPVAGFYTYGEIARTRGSRGMHHLTVSSLAIG